MPTATLRRVGGSVMVAVPPDYLTQTGLGPNEVVAWEIEGNRLVMHPTTSQATLHTGRTAGAMRSHKTPLQSDRRLDFRQGGRYAS